MVDVGISKNSNPRASILSKASEFPIHWFLTRIALLGIKPPPAEQMLNAAEKWLVTPK